MWQREINKTNRQTVNDFKLYKINGYNLVRKLRKKKVWKSKHCSFYCLKYIDDVNWLTNTHMKQANFPLTWVKSNTDQL